MARPRVSAEPVAFEQVQFPAGEHPSPGPEQDAPSSGVAKTDWGLVAGFAVSVAAIWASGGASGIGLGLFLQPAGIVMVVGGTLGATLVTTPSEALGNALRRLCTLVRRAPVDRAAFVEEVVGYSRIARAKGLLHLEPLSASMEDPLLREGLMLAMDGLGRDEVAAALELRLRLVERQGETDARVLESAGGFAPTIGVMGTVLGLLEVMRQFSDLGAVAAGVGTAFVSTLYGLGLANLVLLPLANRIRASAAETYELGEMAMEAALCVRDGVPPRLVKERLTNYVR